MPAMACGFESHHRHQNAAAPSWGCRILQGRDSNGSGSEWSAGGHSRARSGLRRSGGRVPPPAPRQKNSASFRFRGLRKSRENCTSPESFFLFQIEPASPGFDLDTGPDSDSSGFPEKGHPKGCPFSGAAPSTREDPLRSIQSRGSTIPLQAPPMQTWYLILSRIALSGRYRS